MQPIREVGHDQALPDGTTVHLRRIRPDDRQRLLQMWSRTSEESRRRRFLGPFELTEGNVGRFTDLDTDREEALVATLGRGADERIIGVARYVRYEDEADTAEFAALVEDAQQGRGVGTALLRHLVDLAREAGVRRLTGDILADNTRMLNLVRDLGLDYQRRPASAFAGAPGDLGPGHTVRAEMGLDATPAFLEAVAADEKRASRAALERFLRPRRVAVVGASRDPDAIGGLVFGNLLRGGFTGVVYPVNPKAEAIQGVAAYPSLRDCPAVPDLIIVTVPAAIVPDVLEEAGELGVRAACIISAGFAEAGEEARQDELMARARAWGMRLVGPNCMGLLNAAADVRMNGTFSPVFPGPGRLAFSSQSGALGLAVLEHADRRGLGMSTFVSVGNKADISGNNLLLYWEDDEDTDVILLYLESFGNPRRFSRVARRISRRKPIVAVKSGRTKAGARAASSHTGALAAGDVAVDALFRQTGVIRTDTLQELFGVAAILSSQPLPTGPRVAIVTNAGGPGILAADACEANGLSVPALSESTTARLSSFLPAAAGLSNPVDLIASGTPEQYGEALRVLGQADEVDAVFVISIPVGPVAADEVARALVTARDDVPADKPVVSVFMSAEGVPDALAGARIPSFAFPEDAARALGRVSEYAAWRRRPLGEMVRPDGCDPDRALGVIEQARKGGAGWLDTAQATEVLAAYGIPLARSRIVAEPDEGATVQREWGVPVAVKVAAPIHKTDVGGIDLGLTTPEEVAAAMRRQREELEAAGMGEHAGAWVIQEMVTEGVEMAVGVSHDPSFGPLVMVGMGGTLVELIHDVSVRVTPLTDVDVDEMLGSLRMRPLLYGYRGSDPADVGALRDLLHRVNAMVEDLPQVAELDLNPVFARSDGVVAVDVRLRVAEPE